MVPEGATEREPVRCDRCGARYRHPKMAFLLSMALPGLGSIYLGRRVWGTAVLAFGTGIFGATLWRMGAYLLAAYRGETPSVLRFVADAALGTALVVLSYAADLVALWLRRDQLVPR